MQWKMSAFMNWYWVESLLLYIFFLNSYEAYGRVYTYSFNNKCRHKNEQFCGRAAKKHSVLFSSPSPIFSTFDRRILNSYDDYMHSNSATLLFYFLESFSHQRFSDSKFSQVYRTFLSILADVNYTVVWIVSSRPQISKFTSPFINLLLTAQSPSSTIGITVTLMFHSFFQFFGKVYVLYSHMLQL